MKEYTRFYKIADIVFKIKSPFSITYENKCNYDFLVEETTEDFLLEFEHINDINSFFNDSMQLVHRTDWMDIFQDNKEEYCFFKQYNLYFAVTHYVDELKYAKTYYLDDRFMQKLLKEGCSPLSYIRIEKGFIQNDAFLLHSCHIQYGGKSILFSAPSGTGKSTQGELWNRYLNADIINGDRTVLKKNKSQWYAYGVPMNGTSGITVNSSEVLGSIIVIRQGKTEYIKRVSAREAFRYIYSETTISTWSMDFVEKIIELVSLLVEDVPVYYFECTKEKSAVGVLLNRLKEDDIFEK